jgi:hypothetical protein
MVNISAPFSSITPNHPPLPLRGMVRVGVMVGRLVYRNPTRKKKLLISIQNVKV